MKQEPYLYKSIGRQRYIFISTGKKAIVKMVEFTPSKAPDIVNLGFGDLLPDNTLDDKSVSNNGDIVKTFATIIVIVKAFTGRFPYLKIAFTGSTAARTKLYNRILKMYYFEFSKEFLITGLVKFRKTHKEVKFHPKIERKYLFFFIKKI